MRIAFVGKKAAGKTFAAHYLKTQYKFKKAPLRAGVGRIVRILYYYGAWKHIGWEQQLRIYDALYAVDPNIWIGYLERNLSTTTMDVVVDDARYINEVQKLKELGFIIIRINVPDDEARKRRIGKGLASALDNTVVLAEYFHKDITSVYKADYTIMNDTKESCRKAIDMIIEKERKNS